MPAAADILTLPVRKPAGAIVVALCFAALAAFGLTRIHADPSLEAMFSRDSAAGKALSRVLNDFGAVDEVLVVATLPGAREATPADVDRLLRFGQRLTQKLAQDPQARQLSDGAFYRPDDQTRAYFEKVLVPAAIYFMDDATFAAARARLTRAQMTAQLRQDETMMTAPGAAGSLAKALMADPLRLREFLAPLLAKLQAAKPINSREGVDAFVSPGGRSLLVRVRGNKSPSDVDFCATLTRLVAAAADEVNADRLQLRYAGSYAVVAESASAIRADMISSVIGSVLFLQLLFLLAYRSAFRLFALAFGPIALGVILGFFGYSLLMVGLTPMTAVLGGVLTGMAIDYSIQYLSMYEGQRDAGADPRAAAERSAQRITPAALAAWATSVVGFLAIGASSVKALRDFSLLGALGLGGAFIAVVALLPMMLRLTDPRPAHGVRSRLRFSLAPLLAWLSQRTGLMIALSAAIVLLAGITLLAGRQSLLPLESDLTVMHPRPNAAIDAQNFITREFGLHDSLVVHLTAASEGELLGLAHRVDADLQSQAARSAGVVSDFGLATLLPDPDVALRRARELTPAFAEQVLADFRAAVADSAFNPDAPEIREYESFLKVVLTRPPPTLSDLLPYRRLGELLLPRSAFEKVPVTEAIAVAFISGSTDQRESRDRAVDGIRAALAGETGATVTGISVMSRDTEAIVRRDLPRLSLIAVVIVLIYLAIHFRNASEALLAMAPTAFSLTVLLAAMRLAGEKVNMINLVAAPLLIGIDVDYGIFLVSLARLKQVKAETTDQLIARIAPVCHAVLICAMATIIGFGSLMWTSVPAIASLGFAVAVGIGACLFSVLFLLTPIFLALTRAAPAGLAGPAGDAA